MKKIINTSVAPIYREPSFNSEMVTQALLWESVTVIEQKNDWLKVEQWDGYVGWIQSFYLTTVEKKKTGSVIIQNRLSPIYSRPSVAADIIDYLSVGTEIPGNAIIDQTPPFLKFAYPDSTTGYLFKKKAYEVDTRKTLVRTGLKLHGTPYLWGGKSGFGFDCSGFIQTLFFSIGLELPRDSHQQYEKLKPVELYSASPGDLVFFRTNDKISHVGIYMHVERFIHCSGSVKINSLNCDDPLYESWVTEKFDSIRTIKPIITK
ncbi:MAG: C40 family peptidase [Candidatus Marinimicrobia bacterium]|nr:C40 family peptidase [Candidatus Neomarinimicrobiota bacterium]